ncbi:MAG: hypothetical protein ABIX01_19380 [Chitinophagaceae bacterium]
MSEQEHETPMTEQESLALITSMIQKAKSHFHESGTGAILWGAVIGFCGIFSFVQYYWNLKVPFDIWILVLVAIIPQVWLNIRDKKRKVVKSHSESATDTIWMVYAISIFALLFYINVVSNLPVRLNSNHVQVFQKDITTGMISPFQPRVPSPSSLLILLYAVPTLATGIGMKFKPMVIGAIICYGFFIASCFTSNTWDVLMNGLAAIFNWLIPGAILRNRYLKRKALDV